MDEVALIQQMAATARLSQPPTIEPVQGVLRGIRARSAESSPIRMVEWLLVVSSMAAVIVLGVVSYKAWEILDNPIYELVTLTHLVMT